MILQRHIFLFTDGKEDTINIVGIKAWTLRGAKRRAKRRFPGCHIHQPVERFGYCFTCKANTPFQSKCECEHAAYCVLCGTPARRDAKTRKRVNKIISKPLSESDRQLMPSNPV